MLLLKPSCERCDKDLPPQSLEAMICSFEIVIAASIVKQSRIVRFIALRRADISPSIFRL